MKHLSVALVSSIFLATAQAVTFLQAISTYPELSNFTALFRSNESVAQSLLTAQAATLTSGLTVLVPNNNAFARLQAALGVPVGSLSIQQLTPILAYHTLVDNLTYANISANEGVAKASFLMGPQYNNRSAGAALGSRSGSGDLHNGQVVVMQKQTTTGSLRLAKKQNTPAPLLTVTSGLGQQVNMTAVDGSFEGGRFQIVDGFLTLPLNCTASIQRWGATALTQALQRTGLGTPLDTTQNVTCLAPNNAAFLSAGSPESRANVSVLANALLFHTLTQPVYTNFIKDGDEYQTYANMTVRFTIRNGTMYANDARMLKSNIITNNGLMHFLDKVMTPLEKDQVSSSNTTTTSTATAISTRTSSTASTTSGASSTRASTAATSSSAAGSIPSSSFLPGVASWVLLVFGFLFT